MRLDPSGHSRDLALDLLDQYGNHISAELLGKSTGQWHFDSLARFSALHYVSYFGIAEVAILLIKMEKWDLNQPDGAMTPLIWAAMRGNKEVVELLLQQKHTKPDMPDTRYGRTALSWAAASGHEEVVRLFLGPLFVDPGRMGLRFKIAPRVMSLSNFPKPCE